MKKKIKTCTGLLLLLVVMLCGCSRNPSASEDVVIPKVLERKNGNGIKQITEDTKIWVSTAELRPLALQLQEHLHTLSGLHLEISEKADDEAICFILDKAVEPEAYHLKIRDQAVLSAAEYASLARGLASLVQLMTVRKGKITLPKTEIHDQPDYSYRAVLIDLARFWHPVETVKEAIDLLWFYKIPYLHLHLSDNSRFTFPVDELPQLKIVHEDGSREYYSREELEMLVEYARQRGVIIIPEIDLPGHSAQLWRKCPEQFGHIDPVSGQPKELYVVNMARESCYEAIEKIIHQLAEVFYTSPYIHFGGDEVYLQELKKLPEYAAYCKKNKLEAALEGKAQELFCHFINRLNTMVKDAGKKSIIWEGFPGSGAGSVSIDKDIDVIVWNTSYNRPDSLLKNGFRIINSTWIPWYLVGAMNLSAPRELAFKWDLNQWSHWNENKANIVLPSKQGILGAQICFWEQNHYKVIRELRSLIPVLSERLWNNKADPCFGDFEKRFQGTNARYQKLFHPVNIQASGLLSTEDQTFVEPFEIRLSATVPGKIMYHFSDSWKLPDMKIAAAYNEPLTLNNSGILTTWLVDEDGHGIGFPQQEYFQRITPAYRYKVFGPAPQHGWNKMPDFTKLDVIREGTSGLMSPERLEKINGELFAKVKAEGHIEVRFRDIYNPYALELSGNILCPETAEYHFRIQTHDGLANLYLDDKLIAKGQHFDNSPEDFSLKISKGNHRIRIEYFYKHIQNQLSILYKTDNMPGWEAFEELVQLIE